jgi:inner membrane protein
MPSVFSHAIAAVALGGAAIGGPSRLTIWGLGALCAVVPDLDVVSFHVGLPYGHMLGHRGLSHSLLFAAGLASIMTALLRRTRTASPGVARLWAFFFLATASHGVLDAMTNGGLGVAFFAPFSDDRYFFPWQPIVVSPISIDEFFGPRGLRVMWSELGWVWLPSAVVFLAGLSLRFLVATSRRPPSGDRSRGQPGRF